jgi:hypothetical protein
VYSRRRGKQPIIGIVIALILGFWLGTQYENGWPFFSSKKAPPPLTFDDLVPTCTHVSVNGDVLVRNVQTDEKAHSIEIANGSSGNAIVKVLDADTHSLDVSFFVAANQTASYDYLPDGNYLVQYAFGDKLAKGCRAFINTTSAAQFPNIETMTANPTPTGVTFTSVSFTLYTVPTGNVIPQSINPKDFDAEK